MVLTWAESLLVSIGFVGPTSAPRQQPSETATSTADTPTLSETLPPQLMRLFQQHQQNTNRYMEDLEDRTGLRLAILESKLDAVMPLLAMMEPHAAPVGSGDVPTVVSTSVPPPQAVAAPPAPVQAVAAPPPPPPAVTVATRPPAAPAPVAGVSVPVAVPPPAAPPTPPARPSSSSSPSPLIVARPNMQYYYLR
eukprot:gene15129-10827_t